MRTFVPTLAALVMLSGCPMDPVCSGAGRAEPAMVPADDTSWSHDSEVALVSFTSFFSGSCTGTSATTARPDSVVAEVLSPTNAVIASEVVDAHFGDAFSATASVRFTPSEGPGIYLVTATFLPVGGRQSRTLLVLSDRRAEAPALGFPRPCLELAVMPSGVVVCDGVAYWPDGHTQSPCMGSQHVAAGGTLWCHDGSYLSALVEADGGFVERGRTSLPDSSRVLAEEDRVLVASQPPVVLFPPSTPQLQRFTVEDGGLSASEPFGIPGYPGGLVTKGETVYVADLQPTFDTFGLPSTNVCAYDLGATPPASVACQVLPGEVYASADGTFVTGVNNTLRAFAPGPDGKLLLLDTLPLPLSMSVHPLPNGMFAGNWVTGSSQGETDLVVRVKGGALRVEQFPRNTGTVSARPDHTWGVFSSTTKLWKNRP